MKKTLGKFGVVTDEQIRELSKKYKQLAYGCTFVSYRYPKFKFCSFHCFGEVPEGYERVCYGSAQAGDIVFEMATYFIDRYSGEKFPEFASLTIPYHQRKLRKDDSCIKCRSTGLGSVWRKKELIDRKRNALASCNYICTSCVAENGGKFVDGHCYTAHMGVCPVCEKEKSLGCVSDFDWPKKSEVQQLDREI